MVNEVELLVEERFPGRTLRESVVEEEECRGSSVGYTGRCVPPSSEFSWCSRERSLAVKCRARALRGVPESSAPK